MPASAAVTGRRIAMAGRNEKNPERNMLLVDASRLGQGIKSMFMGVAMVFDSLGMEEAAGEIGAAGEAAEVKAVKNPAVEIRESGVAEPAGDLAAKEGTQEPATEAPSTADDSMEGVSVADASTADASQEGDKPEGGSASDSASAGTKKSAVTVDDITKVIVAKIKQKRSNNAKIGALLKTYGVEKVSSLPEGKYEAFLTDISQL